MSSITFKTPLTADERNYYEDQFRKLDKEDLGIVTGEAAKPLFAGSSLSAQILSQVWAMVDINNKGFLNKDEFSAALRTMGHLQQYPTLPVTAELYSQPPARLPNLNGIVPPLEHTPTSNLSTASVQGLGQIPPISAQDVSKFSQLYERAANGATTLAGDKAKEIFLKARLPNQILGTVWGLCDKNASGSLEKPEFIMAMHLIQLLMTNNPSVSTLPTTLPPQLWKSLDVTDAQVPAMPLSANSTGRSSLTRQGTISRLSAGVFTNASTDWSLSFDKKQQFDAIFDSLDKSHAGALSAQVLVPFFLSSRLNQETLASIWDLADIHNNAEFSKVEFAIAMFLIQKKNAGAQLPDVIPDQLLQSPALGLYTQQQTPQMAIPSRDTKPSFQDPQQQQSARPQQLRNNSNNGSLSDLLALNSSFSSPSQPQQRLSSVTSGQDSTSGSTPGNHSAMRGYFSQPDWGNDVINEADEDMDFHRQQAQQMQQPQPTPQSHQTPQAQHMQQAQQLQQVPQAQQLQQQPQQLQQQPQQQPPQQQYQQANVNNIAQPVQPVQAGSAPQPVPRASSVNLSSVPNFASLSMPVAAVSTAAAGVVGGAIGAMVGGSHRQSANNNDLFADAEASAQLSSATTEMANLSNQVNSLSKQASMTNEKKSRAEQELKRVNEMKASVESKLASLRSAHENNVKQTEQMEAQLADANKETEALNQQLTVTEGNYHAVESKVAELSAELDQAQQRNAQLKEQITGLNTMASTMQGQLTEKQQQAKQQRSLVDVNSKQLEVSQLTVSNLETEIQGLTEKLAVYLTKRKELDDYQKTVEEQHSQLELKYQDLESKNADLNVRTQELDERNQQVEEQERIYEEHVAQLQKMFEDLSERKGTLDKAEGELKQQHIDYARNIQLLTEKQIKLGMGEIPESDAIPLSKEKDESTTNHGYDEGEVSKFVEDSVANSKLGRGANEDEEKPESDVFGKDVPTVGSQTEADDDSEAAEHITETERVEHLADRFEGDLNEYGIPRTQSLTSSVANNAPQSVIDDIELPQTLEETSNQMISEAKNVNISNSQIPGQWEPSGTSKLGQESIPSKAGSKEAIGITSPTQNERETQHYPENNLKQSPLIATPITPDHDSHESNISPNKQTGTNIDEEFPPIKELDINESDSSSSDDQFEDTKEEVPTYNPPTFTQAVGTPSKDEFDDEFAGLEQAADEESLSLAADEDQNNGSMEEFEKIEHQDLDEELQQNGFTGTSLTNNSSAVVNSTAVGSTSPLTTTEDVTNDEWDEIFAGFGNSKQPAAGATTSSFRVQEPVAAKSLPANTKSPVNRKVATTPKSLAVEELSGMGFTEDEAHSALERCNWDLEAATNFLLDSA